VRYQEAKVRAITVLALTIVATVPLLPLLSHGAYPETHENLRYPALTEYFRTAILNGSPILRAAMVTRRLFSTSPFSSSLLQLSH
jgi:hypothetical protein